MELLPINKPTFTISLRLTKKRKPGRPSKKDKEMFGTTHYFEVTKDATACEIGSELQKQIDKEGLPIKLSGYDC